MYIVWFKQLIEHGEVSHRKEGAGNPLLQAVALLGLARKTDRAIRQIASGSAPASEITAATSLKALVVIRISR